MKMLILSAFLDIDVSEERVGGSVMMHHNSLSIMLGVFLVLFFRL